jgi:tetratricopeptide (TPR) repeat protein
LNGCLIGVLFICSFGYAQESREDSESWSGDYFTAREHPTSKTYLFNVDGGHTDVIPKWLRENRIDNVLLELRYILDRIPNHPRALQYLSLVARLTKNASFGNAYFQNAIKRFPQYAITHAQYGLYLVQFGQPDAGIELLKKSVEMDPELSLGYAWLARAYFQIGKPDLGRLAASRAKELGNKDDLVPEQ